MTEDVVAELDRWLAVWRGYFEGTPSVDCPVIQRARDEIVALRSARNECERQFQEQVAATGRLFDRLWLARAEALEEAAQRCDRLATDYTIPISADNWSDWLPRLRWPDPRAEGEGVSAVRATGYYWILFNWPLFDPARAPEWQPASWDDVTSTWVVIGSRQEVPSDEPCIIEVDERRIERSTS